MLGQHQQLVGELESFVVRHPLRDAAGPSSWWRCIGPTVRPTRCARNGRLRLVLGEELGIEPSRELAQLEEAILLQKPELDWEPPSRVPEVETRRSPPSGTVTFLFTDLVDSTALWDRFPRAMTLALARHDQIIRETIARTGRFRVR